MAAVKPRRLIINADDFGRSSSINQAVVQAHREGVLTSASLMVNEPARDEAVQIARENPTLAVGLHLTVCCGRATLPWDQIPALAGRSGHFGYAPVALGLRYFISARARRQLRAEIHAQFEKFAATGLPLDHVNGHLHFHLHPAVFGILLQDHTIPAMRLTRDPLRIDWALGQGRWGYRLSHALIFGVLARRARRVLAKRGVPHTANVFGLLESERISEAYLLRLLPVLPPGDSELYSHPSLDEFKHEFSALVSPRVRRAFSEEGIQLIQYRDLWPNS